MKPLGRAFFQQPARRVARQLIGAELHRRWPNGREAVGRIVETEAYVGPHDLACHAAKGRTARTEILFGEPGYAYVFLIYGMYSCLNVVTDSAGHPAAVLLRALEPLRGIELSTQGPGRLCRALEIDRSFNGEDLRSDRLFVVAGTARRRIAVTPRIGVDYAGDWAQRRLRYIESGNPWVSGPKSLKR